MQDILAGATGAVAGAPQAMGFALIAGVNPVFGLYSAVVPTLIGAFTASSSFMTIGPTNAVALVVGNTLIAYTGEEQIPRLFVLTLLVGLFQLLFGLLRLGNLLRFVSNAVMTGFITGAGFLIILGQLSPLTGYSGQFSGAPIFRFADWLTHPFQFQPTTVVLGLFSIILIVFIRRTRFRNFAVLITLISASLVVHFLGWQDVSIVRDISAVPRGLPQLVIPDFSFVPEMLAAGFAIALLASVQAAGITRSFPQADGSMPKISRDLIAQGLGNLGGSFFQCMPTGGSLSRSVINVSAGARSPLSNIVAASLIAIILIIAGPLIEHIPLAALSAQLIVAAAGLIRFDALAVVWRVNWSARAALIVTFLSTFLFPLEMSIYFGVLVSLLLYVYSSSKSVKVVQLVPIGAGRFREEPLPKQLTPGEVVIVSVSGHLYFAAASHLEERLPLPKGGGPSVVILRLRDNFYLGSTGARLLDTYAQRLESCGGKLILAGVGETMRIQLERSGELARLGPDSVFYADPVVFSSTERAYEYAQSWLAAQRFDHPASV